MNYNLTIANCCITNTDIMTSVSARQVSTEKLQPHHLSLVNGVGKTANIHSHYDNKIACLVAVEVIT